MTKLEIKTLTTQLNSGTPLGDTVFDTLLNTKKDILEMSRDWMILRSFDSSITFASSDDYTSTKSLPTRFLRVYTPFDPYGVEQPGVYLIDSAGNKNPLRPIAFASRFDYKDLDGFYYLDIKNSKIGRTGSKAGTLHLFYLQGTAGLDTDDDEWTFPSFAHPLLAYELVIEHKGGIDWDTVNANQVPFNRNTANEIKSALHLWDARLQQAELGV